MNVCAKTSCLLARYTRQRSSFLNKAQKFLNWVSIEALLTQKLGKRVDAAGVLGYPALSMFKILLLQLWYALSDREMDEALSDRASFRTFAGFSWNSNTPSYSTICRFRNKLIRLKLDEKLFKLVNKSLESNKLINNKGIILDTTIVVSSRKPRKIIDINHEIPSISYSGDEEAKWTVKSGTAYYGYKIHMTTDLKHGFITGGFVTGANCSDTKELPTILKKIPVQGAVVLADKGYASQSNREYLNQHGFKDGIMHKALVGRDLNETQKFINSTISSFRGSIERVFGTLKQKYKLNRAKYLGCVKTKAQFILSAIAFNMKKALSFAN